MRDRIVRARTLRACTYRAPDGTWHRDYPALWEGPMKAEHFDALFAEGAVTRPDEDAGGEAPE
jgi:hypothetical protein